MQITNLGITTQISTQPGIFPVAVTETQYPYIVDVSNYLSGSDAISGVTSTLSFASTGAVLSSAWRVSTTIVGNQIIIILDASKLSLEQQYQILVNFTANTNKKPTYTSVFTVVA